MFKDDVTLIFTFLRLKVILWREDSPGRWNRLYEYCNHDSSVNSICWAPHEFGLILAAGSSDGSVSILTYNDASNQWESQKVPKAHTIGCNAVSWAPAVGGAHGQMRFVSGGCDNLVKIWRYDSSASAGETNWVEEAKLEAHSDWVRDVAWSPALGSDRSIIASCSQDKRVIIWTSDNGGATWSPKTLETFDDVVWHVSWSISGNMLAVSGGDNKVSLWKEMLEPGEWQCITDLGNNKQEQQQVNQSQVAAAVH